VKGVKDGDKPKNLFSTDFFRADRKSKDHTRG
jgi:hypothetical protein